MSDNDCVSRKAVLSLLNATSKDEMDEQCYRRLYDAVANMNAVPQEMSARELLLTEERMLRDDDYAFGDYTALLCRKEMDEAIAFAQKWAREHPAERSEE